MATYTVSIEDTPTGTYTKVRTILGDPGIWDYDKPFFTFQGDSSLLAAVLTVEEVKLIETDNYEEDLDLDLDEDEDEDEAEDEEVVQDPSGSTFHIFTRDAQGALILLLEGDLPSDEADWTAQDIADAIQRYDVPDWLALAANHSGTIGLVHIVKDGIVQSRVA